MNILEQILPKEFCPNSSEEEDSDSEEEEEEEEVDEKKMELLRYLRYFGCIVSLIPHFLPPRTPFKVYAKRNDVNSTMFALLHGLMF